MPAYKDAQKGTWYAAFYYQDWKGVKKKIKARLSHKERSLGVGTHISSSAGC